jgi:hypothetical protein
MRKDKNQAINLRRDGKSYNEISWLLKIPKSTLSDWLRDAEWSQKIKQKLDGYTREKHTARIVELDRKRGLLLAEAYQQALIEARQEAHEFKYHPLFIAGIMLYWGEGDKATKSSVRISNVDPILLRLFVCFLKDVCGAKEEDIGASVLLYPDLDDETCRNYWSKEVGLPLENFIKSIRIRGRHKTKRLGYGVCSVYISRTYLKKKMNEWIRILPIELMKESYYANIGDTAAMV